MRLRLARLVGLTCFAAALLTYESERPRLFGRWSYGAGFVVLGVVSLWCAAALSSWRIARGPEARGDRSVRPVALFDAAVLLWGAGYLVGALDAPGAGAAILNLNVFGSTTPAAIVLNWFSLALLLPAGGAWLWRRLTVPGAHLALALAAVSAVALAGEGALRARALLAPATQGFPTASSALWARRYVQLNRGGFRDTEHQVGRVSGTMRALLIGDSFAFGAGVPRIADRLGEQLGARLREATGMPWEVINASHPDLHTLNEMAILDSTLAYHPDVVILVYVFNDIDYLYPVTPRTVLTDAPGTVLQRLHPARLLFKNFFLFQEAYVRTRAIYWSFHRVDARDDPYADTSLVRRHLGDLARFVAVAESGGAVVGIVPFDPAVAGNPVARHRDESFVARALAAGLPVWPVDSAFKGFTIPELTVNRLDAHPNALANRLMAMELWPRVLAGLRKRERERQPSRVAGSEP